MVDNANPAPKAIGDTEAATAKAFEALLFPQQPASEAAQPVPATDAAPAPSQPTEPETEPEKTPESAAPEPEATPDEQPVIYHKVPGTDLEVTLEEALAGYRREADYTRKTQEAAELRKKAEAEAEAARLERARYAEALDQTKKAMDALVPKEPDWGALRAQVSPEQFSEAFAEWQAFKQRRETIESEQVKVAKQQADDAAKKEAERAAQEAQKLLEKLPAWKDPKVADAEQAMIRKYLAAEGWTDEDIANERWDHKKILSFRRAAKQAELEAKVPNTQRRVEKPAVRTVSPGSTPARPTPATDKAKAMERLKKSGGSMDAAAKAFETLDSIR